VQEIELRLIAELLRNSNRSDRELAEVIGVSQPTISRVKARLEKEGLIKEYTIIPDFAKLGFSLCVFTLGRFQTSNDAASLREYLKANVRELEGKPQAIWMDSGLGEGFEGIVVSFHETYSEYLKFLSWLKQFSAISAYDLHTFIIDLASKTNTHFRPLTFQTLANYLLSKTKK